MENNYNSVYMVKKYKLPEQQLLVENNISTEYEVAKILCIESSVFVSPEIKGAGGEATILGKLLLNVVYVDNDGNVNSENHISPFNYKISNEAVQTETKFLVDATAVDDNVTSKNNKELKVITTINFDVTLICNNERKLLSNCGENTYTKLAEIESIAHHSNFCERFEEEVSATIKGGIKKVFSKSIELNIKDVTAGTNYICVEVEIATRILYVGAENENELETIVLNKSFKQEFDAEGATKETILDFMPYVIYDETEVVLDDTDDGTTISIKIPMLFCFNLYEKQNSMNIVDIYSTKNILEIVKDDYFCDNIISPFVIDGKIEGSVDLFEENPRVDKFLCATNIHANLTNTYIKDKTIYLEGIATANVLYLNDETEGVINSVQIEVPFVVSNQTDLDDATNLSAKISLNNVDIMIKRGREIFFDAKIKALVCASKETTIPTITSVDSIGEVPQNESSLEIYFGKTGESIWDIAKNLKIPSQTILNQNQHLTDPLEKDENIAIYYQRTNNV